MVQVQLFTEPSHHLRWEELKNCYLLLPLTLVRRCGLKFSALRLAQWQCLPDCFYVQSLTTPVVFWNLSPFECAIQLVHTSTVQRKKQQEFWEWSEGRRHKMPYFVAFSRNSHSDFAIARKDAI